MAAKIYQPPNLNFIAIFREIQDKNHAVKHFLAFAQKFLGTLVNFDENQLAKLQTSPQVARKLHIKMHNHRIFASDLQARVQESKARAAKHSHRQQ